MKILVLNWRDVRHPKSGGAELVTMEHAKGWVKRGNSVTWLTAHYEEAKWNENVEGVRFIRRAGSQTIYLYAPVFLLFHAREYDVIVDEVHGFPFFSPIFTRTPIVMFIHEIAGDIWDYMFPFPKNIIGKILESLYFRVYRMGYVWTAAQSTAQELVDRGIPRNKCVIIPNPIVPSDHKIPVVHKEKYPTYLFVSRVVRMKGVEEVIKAFSFISREDGYAVLWIIGGGEEDYIRELKRMINEYGINGKVFFFGIVSEQEKYDRMARAHILLHASVKEGWGLVVLEAASVRTPSVVYNVSGLKDIVKNGKTGVVIQDNSPQEMARQAMLLIKDRKRYATFQKNGLEWVKSLHWDDVIGQSLDMLVRAAEKRVP